MSISNNNRERSGVGRERERSGVGRERERKRKLPIGIQTFREMRAEGYYYVDKTAHIQQLVEGGKHYFLSRPRRFGKSLLLDTIGELFAGSEELFRGLSIHDQWDWQAPRPVLRISFGGRNFTNADHLQIGLSAQLDRVERRAGLRSPYSTGPERFAYLIEALREAGGRRVVILIDEYDKPILDALGTPQLARANRDYLRGLYSVVKECDEHIRFTLLTGVSKFSKVSLFSGLNNLRDITLDPRYGAICGYTDRDLDAVFAPELPGLDREEIRRWYNGYSWLDDERVYNPFDILLLFDTRRFKAHWFETGSPTFLIDALLRRRVPTPHLEDMTSTEALLSAFDVDEMAVEALLFQTGYLTILDEDHQHGTPRYRLGYPNLEVRQSLNEHVLMALLPDGARRLAQSSSLRELLAAGDFAGLESLLRAVFAGAPHQWHIQNNMQDYEGYYASVVYSHFAAQGLDLITEESSAAGRADMTVRADNGIYLFEFKVVDAAPTGQALRQLKERGYAGKYRHLDLPIHLLGVEFSRAQRNIAAFQVERVA